MVDKIKDYMLSILNDEPDMFDDLITDATASLASDLVNELENFTKFTGSELSVMQSELGLFENPLESATNVLASVFAGASISDWIAEDEQGYVFGWRDNVCLSVVENGSGKYLAHVKSYLDNSYANVALRLFEFFSNSDEGPFKNAIVVANATEEAKQIMSDNNVTVFDFVGTQLC